MIPTLTVKRIGERWWIVRPADYAPIGPYNKKEAKEVRVRLLRFFRHEDEPGYVTIESLRKKENEYDPR